MPGKVRIIPFVAEGTQSVKYKATVPNPPPWALEHPSRNSLPSPTPSMPSYGSPPPPPSAEILLGISRGQFRGLALTNEEEEKADMLRWY